MEFKDNIEEAFSPLKNYVEDQELDFDKVMSDYMYMFNEEDIYHYKHKNDRNYIQITQKGKKL